MFARADGETEALPDKGKTFTVLGADLRKRLCPI